MDDGSKYFCSTVLNILNGILSKYLLASFALHAMQTKFPSILNAFTKDGRRGKDASDDHCGVSVGQSVTTESLPMLLRSASVM